MKCSECEALLIDHASRELEEPARTEVARHLSECSSCALSYCRLQADLEGLIEAHVEAPRQRVFHELRRQVAAEYAPSWRTRTWLALRRPVPMYGAVLASLIPAVLWLVSASRPTPESTSPPPTSSLPSPSPTLTDYGATEPPPGHRDVL
ncbi:MAG: zf-HC2 domain-containing protein [Myxococcota bacterium]